MTDVSLRDYFERVLSEKERAHKAEFEAAQQALKLATEALVARLETMNEFRAQITEERADYVRREGLYAAINPIDDRLRKMEDRGANLDGRFWALGIGLTIGLAVFSTLVSVVLRFAFKS